MTCSNEIVRLAATLSAFILPLALNADPALRVLRKTDSGNPRLRNGGFEEQVDSRPAHWRPWAEGFDFASGEGRAHSAAITCKRHEEGGEFGASQTLMLNLIFLRKRGHRE